MPSYVEKPKEKKIKAEERKLRKALADLDKNKLEVVLPLIKNAA